MPRVATAVFVCGVGLCLFAGVSVAGASTPVFTEMARISQTEEPADTPLGAGATNATKTKREAGGEVRTASRDPVDGASKREAGNADSEPGGKVNEESERAPARQVPVEPIETSTDHSDFEASESRIGSSDTDDDGESGSETIKDPGHKQPATETAAPASGSKKEAGTTGPHATKTVEQPGLPIRKPPKPIVQRKRAAGEPAKKSPASKAERSKKLCRALQACRNGFVKCKNKIKYPDQSEPWIIAKEECGAVYKTCVAKDFQGGEWALTRWFYFKELQCE